MKVLNYEGYEFCAAHFQGGTHVGFTNIVEHIKKQNLSLPHNIEIVTACNIPDHAMLINQLNDNNISYHNKAEKGGYWNNLKKIGYIHEALKDVKSEYVLILDAGDVLLTPSVKDILQLFRSYSKKLIFGATKNNYPDLLIDKIQDRDFRGEFRYLNAGTCFGTTEYCKIFYKKASDILNEQRIYNPAKSEQLIIRHAFKYATEEVDFDYKCRLFQTFGSVVVKETETENFYIM